MMFSVSAAGEALPEPQTVKIIRAAPRPFVPVRFSVIEYGDYTKLVYEGNDREKAEAKWAGAPSGIFLASDAEHAWQTVEKR
jgi:hypothetical protein